MIHTSNSRNEEYHLFELDGLKRLDDYVKTCHALGVKYVPYLFADQGYYDIYRAAGPDPLQPGARAG